MHGGNIFEIARAHGWDWREIADFSASINPLGPAPGVAPAICSAMGRIVHYPDRHSVRLRQALSQAWNISEDQIMAGNGATELIFFIARMFAPGKVTVATPAFQEFHRAFDNAALARLDRPGTWPKDGLLCLTSPANPTGSTMSLEVLERHLQTSAGATLIDESFIEYSGLASAIALLRRYPPLMVLRSLTKFYALPGLRAGALVASAELLRKWRLYREPWQVNVLAEEAAITALNDTEHASRSLEFVSSERAWLREQLTSISGIEPLASHTNFLYVPLEYQPAALAQHMLKYKILIRDCSHWPGLSGPAIRIAVRRRDENLRLLNAWREFQCA
jgi:threonine-phosphate decarboxylase